MKGVSTHFDLKTDLRLAGLHTRPNEMNRLQRTQSMHAGRRLSFSERSDPPEAPDFDSDFSHNDYVIANFEDMNDDEEEDY